MALPINFPDPALLQVGDTWYAYSTSNIPHANGPGYHVQLATSKDFVSWSIIIGNDPLPSPGDWAHGSEPRVWAPDVMQLAPDRFVLYYAARSRDSPQVHCVGTAISNSPIGPFIPSPKPFACPVSGGGAIDPDIFRDVDNKLYVTYKVDGSAIAPGGACGNGDPATRLPTPLILQEIDQDGVTPIGPAEVLLDRDDGDGPLIEAPSLARAGDTYFLFFSSNCFNVLGYDVSYATARSVRGPWAKAHSPAQTAPLLLTDMYRGVPPGGLVAPGGIDVIANGDGTFKAVFHGSDQKNDLPGTRYMYTATLRANGNSIDVL
ncbi:MAG: hypothetical protein M1814_003541 [Vezdaea aestivalis]|nr:MAG: hypothetical protein M1814_003541 [Vezdaea aestivalis]